MRIHTDCVCDYGTARAAKAREKACTAINNNNNNNNSQDELVPAKESKDIPVTGRGCL
jgi:hypothetical protein